MPPRPALHAGPCLLSLQQLDSLPVNTRCSCSEGNTGHKLPQGVGEKHTLRGGQDSWISPRPRTCNVPAMTHRHLSLHLTKGTTAASRCLCPLLYQTHSHSRRTAQPQQVPAPRDSERFPGGVNTTSKHKVTHICHSFLCNTFF